MRPSSTLDACGLALGVALLSLHVGEAFLCPTAVLGSSRESMTGKVDRQQQQRRLAVKRAVGRMTLGEEGGQGDGSGLPCALPLNEDASGAARKGPLRRLKSLVGRKTATAAAVSALLTAGTPGRAEALFGRGKTPEAPPVPALEQRLQDGAEALEGASEGLTDAVEGLGLGEESDGDAGAIVDGDATGLLAEGGVSLPMDQGTDGTIPSPSTSTTSAEGFQQESLAGVSSSSSPQSSSGGSAVAARKSKEGSAAGGGVVGALEAVREVVLENKEIAAVAIAGAAGATVLVSRSSGGGGGSSRGRKGSKRAPRSPLGAFGKPRVSPEVAAADAKRKADSLKKVNFEVDLELFGDAVSDFPVRPPPPAPPAPEPVPSPSETIQGAMAARDAVAEEDVLEASAGTGSSVTVAAEESAVESPPVEAAVEAPAEETKKQDKPKRKGPMMNLFKRDSGPQRSTTMDEAMCAETADVATFRQATAAVLARSAPQGSFDVRTPRALEEATTTTADAEGEAEGDEAVASGRVAALTSLMQTAGLSTTEAADAVADVVNAMVVSLVDDAVTSKDEEATGKAADALLDYMDGAGALFVSLCPGVELKPQIKYNGSFKRGKLEKVFEAAARTSLKMGDEGQMTKLDRLQDLFSIKEAKASSITQKIMMELMMKMMSEGGGEDTEGLEKMMASMGGGDMGGMGGMGGMPGMGARSPEDHKQEVAALKAMVESGECPKEEVDGLRKMYKDAGMDIDTLVNDPMMESSMDADAKEVVVLLRKLLALWPKT